MYVVFDTETTGLPKRYNAPVNDFNNWPRLVQIAWKVYDKNYQCIDTQSHIIKPNGWFVPDEAAKIHRVTTDRAIKEGIPLSEALDLFQKALVENKFLIAHNISFDEKIVGCEYLREGRINYVPKIRHIDTKNLTVDFCKIPRRGGRGFKWPTLTELHIKLFNQDFQDAHDALVDVEALASCFFKLQEIGWFNYTGDYEEIDVEASLNSMMQNANVAQEQGKQKPYVNLCLHTFHSILQSAGSASDYIKIAKENGLEALGISDLSSLSGTFEFYNKCKENDIKPIFGIDLFINEKMGDIDDVRAQGDSFKQRIYIKDAQGYQNLNKLLYKANTEGFSEKGRIKLDWLFKYKEGLVVTTSSDTSYFSYLLSIGDENKAEKLFQTYFKHFGEDLYIELQFNPTSQQVTYNNFMVKMMKYYNIKPILTNDTFYPKKEDSELQDVVSAIKQKTSIDEAVLMENREQFFFLRSDFKRVNKERDFNYPEPFIDMCLDNTIEIASKCNYEFNIGAEQYPRYEPTQDVIDYFGTNVPSEIIKKLADAKLKKKLTFYHKNGIINITKEKAKEYFDRLDYEIEVIEDKNMLDYFLVNWEIIREYRKRGHNIGPARGCFQIGSLVKMSDNSYVAIEKIEPDDVVIDAFNNPQKVKQRFEYDIEEDIVELEFDNGKKINCTLDHEILTHNRGWVAAKDLTEEDDVVDLEMLSAKITNKTIKPYKGKVFDLEVENSHSYNIEGLGVHNSAAGSLLSWCLDIIEIDPIRFDLYFERFLNPFRNCLTEDCEVLMKDGSHKKISEIQKGDPAETSTGKGDLVQVHVRDLQEDEDVYEIEAENGAIIKLTANHIVPVEREGKNIEVRVDEILDTDLIYTN